MIIEPEQVIRETDGNIKEEILSIIEKIYCKKYIGTLEIYRIIPFGLIVRFGLNCNEKPIYIAAELSDDKFLKYMEKEIRSRRFDFVKYFIGYKEYPYNCNKDRRCIKCHE
nr:MAG TPA: hypothetical protein [Crassvirales sp.]